MCDRHKVGHHSPGQTATTIIIDNYTLKQQEYGWNHKTTVSEAHSHPTLTNGVKETHL